MSDGRLQGFMHPCGMNRNRADLAKDTKLYTELRLTLQTLGLLIAFMFMILYYVIQFTFSVTGAFFLLQNLFSAPKCPRLHAIDVRDLEQAADLCYSMVLGPDEHRNTPSAVS